MLANGVDQRAGPVPAGPISIFRGSYASLPASMLKPPTEGNRTIPVSISWLRDGQSPSFAIQFNARLQQVLNFTQICSLHVDNTRCSSSINIVFPDTGFQVQLTPNSEGFYPVLTNGLEFVAFIDLQPVASDVTILQVMNFLPPPIEFGMGVAGVGAGTVRRVDTVAPIQGGPITDLGSVSLAVPLTVNFGGTGAVTAPLALDNLSGASGATAGTLTRSAGGVWTVNAAAATPYAVTVGGTGLAALPAQKLLVGAGTANVSTPTELNWDGQTLQVSRNVTASLPATPAGAQTVIRGAGADGNTTVLLLDSFGTVANQVRSRVARGTAASRTASQTSDNLGMVLFDGYNGTAYATAGFIYARAIEPFTGTANGAAIDINTTSPGSTSPVTRMSIMQGIGIGTTTDLGPGTINATGAIQISQNTAPPQPGQTGQFMVVAADGQNPVAVLDAYGTGNAFLAARHARGTATAPTAVQGNDGILALAATGYAAAGYGNFPSATISLDAVETFTATAQGTRIRLQTNPLGTAAGVNSLILQGNTATFSGGAGFATTVPNDSSTGTLFTVGNFTTIGGGISGNIYYSNAANWKYLQNGFGVLMASNGAGGWQTYTAASGTAGGTATLVSTLVIDNLGNLQIGGPTATKPGGGSWVAPSDKQLKSSVEPWAAGLAEILQLNPTAYRYTNEDWNMDGTDYVGLDAEAAASVIPEMARVFTPPPQSPPPPGVDDEPKPQPVETQTYAALDHGPLVFALINAVKELAVEVQALKQAAPTSTRRN